MTYPNERLVLLPGIDDSSPPGLYKYHRTGYILSRYCAAGALEYLGCDPLLIDIVDIIDYPNTPAWDQVAWEYIFAREIQAPFPATYEHGHHPTHQAHAYRWAAGRSNRSSEAPAVDISIGNHGVSVYHELANDMEHGESSQSAPADKKFIGDAPGPSSPYHLLYKAAASAPDHDTSEVAVRAALITPAIDAMTDLRAFFLERTEPRNTTM